MKKFLFLLAFCAVPLALPSDAAAQSCLVVTAVPGSGTFPSGSHVNLMCLDTGQLITNSSGGGGGGDASAANQTSQITQETAINAVLGVKADAKNAATDTTSITMMSVFKQISASIQAAAASLVTIATNTGSPVPAGTAHIGTVGTTGYPDGATAITASATGTTAATTATLAGTSGKTTYICGYSIRANATANTNVTNTITGVITATLSSIMWVPANTAGLGIDEQIFSPCIPASASNTGIAIVSGAPGTGGLVSSRGWGYQF